MTRVIRVDSRDYGDVILKFVKVVGSRGNRGVEGIFKGRIIRSEREFVDLVREVERLSLFSYL